MDPVSVTDLYSESQTSEVLRFAQNGVMDEKCYDN